MQKLKTITKSTNIAYVILMIALSAYIPRPALSQEKDLNYQRQSIKQDLDSLPYEMFMLNPIDKIWITKLNSSKERVKSSYGFNDTIGKYTPPVYPHSYATYEKFTPISYDNYNPYKGIKIATKYELGTFYKVGFFSGRLNNIYSAYQFYKPLFVGFHYEWFYYDIGISLFGIVNKMDKGKVANTPIDGTFYGKATDFYLSLGGEFFNNDRIAATGTANLYAIIWNNHFRPTKIFHKPSAINKESNEFGNSLSGFGPGIFIDYKFWDFKKSSDNGLALRLRYNAFIWSWGDDYGKDGMMHELSVGLVVILHEKN